MIFPQQGDKVKIVLSSGLLKEGIIEFWTENDDRGLTWTSLKPSPESEESFMIQNYYVAGFLIINENIVDRVKQIKIEDDPTLDKPITDPDLRLKSLVELKKMQKDSELQQVRKLLKRTDLGSVKEVQYNYPFKKRSE